MVEDAADHVVVERVELLRPVQGNPPESVHRLDVHRGLPESASVGYADCTSTAQQLTEVSAGMAGAGDEVEAEVERWLATSCTRRAGAAGMARRDGLARTQRRGSMVGAEGADSGDGEAGKSHSRVPVSGDFRPWPSLPKSAAQQRLNGDVTTRRTSC